MPANIHKHLRLAKQVSQAFCTSYLTSILYLLFVVIWVPTLSANTDQSANAQQQAALKQQQAEIIKDIAKLQAWLKQANQAESDLTQQLAQSERNISEANRKIREAKEKLTNLNQKAESLVLQKQQLQTNLSTIESHLAIFLRQQYQLQQRQQAGFLFSLLETEDLSRMMANYRYLSEAQVLQIASYRANLDTLELIQQQQTATEITLATELQQLEREESKLISAQTKRNQALAKLQQQNRTKSQQLEETKAAQKQINALLSQIETVLSQQTPIVTDLSFAQRLGKLSWPTQGQVVNQFGRKQSQFPLSTDGWLIKTSIGSDILAVHDGYVVFTDWFKGFGLMLIINHNDGYLTLYGKNQSLYKRVGDKVYAGELIAKSGNSGNQNTAALYFSIRKDGQPQNPDKWLNQ